MENIVVWFEIPVPDLDRAVKFYTDEMVFRVGKGADMYMV